MKRILIPLFLLCLAASAHGQKITKRYQNTSLSDVLRDLNRLSDEYTINFMYNELEDFLVTTHIRRQSIPDALAQAIGFYPVRIVKHGERELYVECTRKTDLRLTGVITDEQGLPVSYANIAVLHPADSTLLGGGVSTESGYFAIPYDPPASGEDGQDAVLVRISHIGYRTVRLLCQSRQVGTVRMQSAAQQLAGVTVSGQAPILRREAGAIIFDARQIAGAITATDLLRYLPGVYVDDDGISLFGTSGILFCINGKEQHLAQREMLQLLRAYPASDVEKIEVTQAPGAQSVATAHAGVINLILKKKDNDYTGGSLGYAHSQHATHGDEANVSVVCQKGKLSTSLYVAATSGNTRYEETNVMDFSNVTRHNTYDGRISKDNIAGQWQLDYRASDRLILGAYAMYARGKRELDVDGAYTYSRQNAYGIDMLNTQTDRSEDTKTCAMNVYASQKWGDRGDKIDFNADYYHTQMADNRTSQPAAPSAAYIPDGFYYHNDIGHGVTNYSAKLDATAGHLRLGSQYAATRSHRDLTFAWIAGYLENSSFIYDEQVLSAYAEYSTTLGSKLSLNLGGRYEQTWTKSTRPDVAADKTRTTHYGRFFPALSLGFRPGGSHALSWSLSSRITRPNVVNVNPDTLSTDAYHRTMGNPLLTPTYLYKAMMGYSYKGVLSLDLYYTYEPDRMAQVSHIINEEATFRIWDNAIDEQRLGISAFYVFDRLRWMTAVLTQGLWWSRTTGDGQNTLPEEEGLSCSCALQTSFFFDRDRRWTATLSATYNSAEKDVTRRLHARYKVDAGLQCRLWRERLTLGLACRNLLASRTKGTEYIGTTAMDFDDKFNYRQLHLSLIYQWGATTRHDKRRHESDEMQERTVNDF